MIGKTINRSETDQVTVSVDGPTFSRSRRGTYNSCRDHDGYMCISPEDLSKVREEISRREASLKNA